VGRVEGKVALITGAARGQGRSHARRLAEEGADIIALDVCRPIESAAYGTATSDDLAETVALVEALGRRALAYEADARDLPSMTAAADAGVRQLGRLDIVCVNHGIFSLGKASELEPERWQEMLDVNLTGVWHSCRATIPHLLAAGGGSIILTSSTAGLKGIANAAHYTAAKHGVVGLMRALANELAPRYVRVNTIHTTTVPTPMVRSETAYRLFRPDLENPTLDDAMVTFISHNNIPVPWVEEIDVSNAVLFLASDESRYITGVTLPVDAGQLVKG
jgi:(+)-trans-carveol dehydrogenase